MSYRESRILGYTPASSGKKEATQRPLEGHLRLSIIRNRPQFSTTTGNLKQDLRETVENYHLLLVGRNVASPGGQF